MAYVRTLASGKHQGVYRDASGKRHYTPAVTRKRDAAEAAREEERKVKRGEWVDPDGGKITIREWSERWLAVANVGEKTLATRRHLLDLYVLPTWADVELRAVTLVRIKTWVKNLTGVKGKPLSPATIKDAHFVLSSMLNLAVEDGRLLRNPALDASGRAKYLPKGSRRREHVYLDHRQLQRLAAAADPRYRTMVLLAGYVGLRPGELIALTVDDLDMLKRRIRVNKAYSSVSGRLILKSTKTHEARSVTFPKSLASALARQMEGRGRGDLVFTAPEGGPIEQGNLDTRVVKPAARRAATAVEVLQSALGVTPVDGVFGERTRVAVKKFQAGNDLTVDGVVGAVTWAALAGQVEGKRNQGRLAALGPISLREGDRDFTASLTPYALRHTAASLAVASGANVKGVQKMLGHRSAAMTLDVYADLFDDHLDDVADALDRGIEAAASTAR